MAEFWAEMVGRVETDNDTGGTRQRKFEGKYSTNAHISGTAAGVTPVSLPAYGSGYPDASGWMHLREITKEQIGSSGQWVATLSYTPDNVGSWSTSGALFQNLPRRRSIGGELLQFSDTGDYYYVVPDATNDSILGEVPAFRKIATGQLTITEIVDDLGPAITRAKLSINTRNNGAFENSAEGNWLYLGFEQEEYMNNAGNFRYRLHHQFLERDIPGTSNNGWEYVVRDDNGEWAYIQISPAADVPLPIYPSSSFSAIFLAGTS